MLWARQGDPSHLRVGNISRKGALLGGGPADGVAEGRLPQQAFRAVSGAEAGRPGNQTIQIGRTRWEAGDISRWGIALAQKGGISGGGR